MSVSWSVGLCNFELNESLKTQFQYNIRIIVKCSETYTSLAMIAAQ